MMLRTAWWALSVVVAAVVVLPWSERRAGCEARRVVSIPAPATSHVKYHSHVARALAALGHEVWLVMPASVEAKGVLDTTNITVIAYDLGTDPEQLTNQMKDDYFSGQSFDLKTIITATAEICDTMLRNQTLVELLRSLKPDLFVLENLPHVRMLTVLPYMLDVPFAMLGSMYDAHAARIPLCLAATPFPLAALTDDMTFGQRVQNLLIHSFFSAYDPFTYSNMASRYAPEKPYISNDMLIARAEVWLVEMDHILDYPRPSLPNVKLIGGTSSGPAKPLPPEFRSFVEGATQGVVIVSFGSYVLGVPKHISDKLIKVFLKLPMKIIFRSNLTSPDPEKILTSEWIPQNDLLGHPNTAAFVSHCGKNGQYEALYHAVPLLCTPMFGDQPYNAQRIRVKGFGEVVDLLTVSEEELLVQISAVARDPRYSLAISTASTLFRQQYGVPMQEAAKWLDHVMQYGGEYMRFAGQKMPRYKFLLLDVYAFFLATGAVSSVLIYLCVRVVCRCCYKGKPKRD